MKYKYIIGAVFLVAFSVMAIVSFDGSKIDYADFDEAGSNSKTVQIIGSWVKEKPHNYNSEKNLFEFYMKDDKSNIVKVVYSGGKPNNFDIAPKIVVKGKFENGSFHSNQILTKCPSKYEGTADELQNS